MGKRVTNIIKKSGLDSFIGAQGQRVGIYGGSFNPPHQGHYLVSKCALSRLGLDSVWWLVSPRGPIKGELEHSLEERLQYAKDLTCNNNKIIVTDIEEQIGMHCSIDTLSFLQKTFPKIKFVWIMGADNLACLSQWSRWLDFVCQVPIAVFNRPSYTFRALHGCAASRMAHWRVPNKSMLHLIDRPAPAWGVMWATYSPMSSVRIRDIIKQEGM